MRSVSELIEAKGGQLKVAAALHVTAQAVWNMSSRGAIPSRHWIAFVNAPTIAKHKPVTLDELARVAAAKKASAA